MNPKFKIRLVKYAIIALTFFIIHHFIVRPFMLDWGAPKPIQEVRLSGDRLTSGDRHTRAVLVHARAEEIWPWICQLGQERGGFYSYTWLENMFLADMRNTYSINTQWQELRMEGDTIWLATKKYYRGSGFQIVAESIPMRSLVMVNGEDFQRIQQGEIAVGSWAIYLYPENAESTWLIARSSGGSEGIGDSILRYLTFEVPHFIMEQKMLRKIKELAER